jgi:hypothetical protein
VGYSPTLSRDLLLSSGYGSITIVQVYVPGFRPLASTWTGSAKPLAGCGELPTLALLESVHVILDFVPPAAWDVALASMSVSGVSVKEIDSPT